MVDGASVPGVLVGRRDMKLHFEVPMGRTLEISLHPRAASQHYSHTHESPEYHQLMLNKTTFPQHSRTPAIVEVAQ